MEITKSLKIVVTCVSRIKCDSELTTRPGHPQRGHNSALLQSLDYDVISETLLVSLLQGAWIQEGDTLKGTFTRKDNGKQLTTTRIIQGGELVQVSRAPKINQ